VSAAEIALNVT